MPFFCLLLWLLQANNFHALYLSTLFLPMYCPCFHFKFINAKKKTLSCCLFLTKAGWQNRLSNRPLICYYPAFHIHKHRFHYFQLAGKCIPVPIPPTPGLKHCYETLKGPSTCLKTWMLVLFLEAECTVNRNSLMFKK